MSASYQPTKVLYDQSADRWVRGEPTSLSDFTARPVVLGMCEPIAGQKILDLGCGEGYCSRELARRGAAEIYAMDLSEGMIQAAQRQDEIDRWGIQYAVGCATDLSHLDNAAFDVVLAVFLFNYLTVEQMQQCMAEVFRVLRPSGRFIFSVPHPAFPYMRAADYPFYFEVNGAGYFSQQDRQFPGRIWKRDGSWLDVQLIHKPLESYFETLAKAGFQSMPTLRELRVTPEHVQLDPNFFQPLVDYPLHLAIQVWR